MTQNIPVPEPVTGWWPTYYESFRLPAGVTLEIVGRARIPAVVGFRVPVTLEMLGAGTSEGEFALSVPATLGFSGPPPVAANLVIPAGVRFSVEAADRYARSFGFSVTPRIGISAALGVLPPVPGSFGLSVAPRLTIGGREYRMPELFEFIQNATNWQLPDWCDGFDEVALGPGGGGQGGSGGSSHGRGGGAGSWSARRVVRGNGAGELPRANRSIDIVVGVGPGPSTTSAATTIIPAGYNALGVSGAAGAAHGSPNQYGKVPGSTTFGGVKYQGPPGMPGLTDIPANGANYSGWTGCGDGILGGIGTGGAGGRGALISGGDPGGNGCRGQAWIYCWQDKDKDALPPAARSAAVFQGSFTYTAAGGAFPAHAVGDILLVWAYIYAAALPTPPAAGGQVPTWQLIGSPPQGGGALYWARATSTSMNTGAWGNTHGVAVAIIRGAHQTAPIGAVAMTNPAGNATPANMTAPALENLRGRPLGTSQIISIISNNANSWGTLSAGWTSRQAATYFRMGTKNDTTASGEMTTSGHNGNLALGSALSIEILGAAI